MNERILVICPSRGRPQQCKAMIDSFLATSQMSTLKICLDINDPCLPEYQDLIGGSVPFVMGIQRPITEIINEYWQFAADCFRWFSVTNDDFLYKTDGWDIKLTGNIKTLEAGIGIAYGNDLLQGIHLPTTSIVSREIVEALGWLQMPGLTHLFGDNVWAHLGQNAGCLLYRPDVIIEHRHFFARKSAEDAIYKKTNSREMYDRDALAFHNWKISDGIKDVEKIKDLMQLRVNARLRT